jgi:outer membrane autotransporter protein
VLLSRWEEGVFQIATAGAFTGNISNLSIGLDGGASPDAHEGMRLELSDTAEVIKADLYVKSASLIWRGSGALKWDTQKTNTAVWAGNNFFAHGDAVTFPQESVQRNVEVDGAVTVSSLTLEGGTYSFAGGKITGSAGSVVADLTGTGRLEVRAGAHAEFGNNLEFDEADIAGEGVFGGSVVFGGTLEITGTAAFSGEASAGAVSVIDGGSARFARLSAENIAVSSGQLAVLSLADDGASSVLVLGGSGTAGTLALLAGAGVSVDLGARSVEVETGGGVLDLGAVRNLKITADLSGSGSLVKRGAGELQIVGAAKSYAGRLEVEQGSLVLAATDALANAKVALETPDAAAPAVGGNAESAWSQRFAALEIGVGRTFGFTAGNSASERRNLAIGAGGALVVNGALSNAHGIEIGVGAEFSIAPASQVAATGDIIFNEKSVLNANASGALRTSKDIKFTGVGAESPLVNITGFHGQTDYAVATASRIDGEFRATLLLNDVVMEVPQALSLDKYLDVSVRVEGEAGVLQELRVSSSLVWSDTDASRAHGDFNIANGNFTIGAIPDIAAILNDNPAVIDAGGVGYGNWDGRSLVKRGAGVLVLAGENTYSGETHVEDGRLVLRKASSAGSGAAGVVVKTGALVEFSIAAADSGGVFAKPLDGGGDILKSGVGVLTLAVASAHTGETRIGGGVLALGAAGGLAASSGVVLAAENGAAKPELNISATAAGATIAALDGDGRSTVALGAKTLQIGRDGETGGGAGVFAGEITGAGGVVKSGGGVLTLSGANKHTGGVVLREGVLAVANNLALGTGVFTHAGAGAVNLGADIFVANAVELAGGGTREFRVETGGATLTGRLSDAADGLSAAVFRKTGAGTLTLSNASALAGVSGAVLVEEGVLEISATRLDNAPGGAGVLRVNLGASEALFTLGAAEAAAGGFTGRLELPRGQIALDGAKTTALSEATLALGAESAALVEGTAALGALELGGGELRFTATPVTPDAQLRAGVLDVRGGGTIVVEGLDAALATALPAAGGQNIFDYWGDPVSGRRLVAADAVLGDGAGLEWQPSSSAQTRPVDGGNGEAAFDYTPNLVTSGAAQGIYINYTLSRVSAKAGAVVTLDAAGSAQPRLEAKLTGAGGFRFTGGAAQTLVIGNVANDYAGATTLSGTRALLASANAFGAAAPLRLENGAALDMGGHALRVTRLEGTAGTALEAGVLTAGEGVFAGALNGVAASVLVKEGTGTLTLSGAVRFDGAISATGGALAFSGTLGGAAGATEYNGTLDVAAGAGVIFAQAGGQTLTGTLSGKGSLTKTGAGVLTLAGVNTLEGALDIQGGVARVNGALGVGANSGAAVVEAAHSSRVSIATGAELRFEQENVKQVLSGEITGGGALTKAGSGTLTLSGANTLSGALSVEGGVLVVSGRLGLAGAGARHSGGIAVATGAEMRFQQSANQTLSGPLNGGGVLAKSGNGTLTLSGESVLADFSGSIRIDGGRLELVGSGSSSLTLNNALSGRGTLVATLGSASSRLAFGAQAGTAFTGVVELDRGEAVFEVGASGALSNATLKLGAQGTARVETGASLGGLTSTGGTLRIAPGVLLTVGALDITGDIHVAASVSLVADTSAGAGAGNLFDLWNDRRTNQTLVVAVTGELSGSRVNVLWDASSATREVLRDGAGERVGEASFDYQGTVRASGAEKGIYLGHGLTELSADAGRVLELDASGAQEPRLFAKLTGAGAFRFTGEAGREVEIGNAASNYTGATSVSRIRLSLTQNNALGAAAALRLDSGAVVRVGEITQRVTALEGEAGTRVEVAAGGEFSVESGVFAGALGGAGRLVKSGAGELSLTDALARHETGTFANTGGVVRIAGALTASGVVNNAALTAASVEIAIGGELENNGVLEAGALTGSLVNSGAAQIGTLTALTGGRVSNTGTLAATTVSGAVENRGQLFAGAVNGGVVNHAGARLTPLSTTNLTINGDLKNDGEVWFENYGQTLRVNNLSNATAGGVGRYNMEIDIADPAASDHVELVGGKLSGKHEFVIRSVRNGSEATRETRLELVSVNGGVIASGAQISIAGGGVDAGAYRFSPETSESGTLVAAGFSALTQSAVNTAGMMAPAWFGQLDNLAKRLGELRAGGGVAKLPPPSQGGAWVRAHAQQVNADLGLEDMSAFRMHQYGADIGGDFTLSADSDAVALAGVFVGYQSARLRFRDGTASRGDTDTFAFGAYATWMNAAGWHLDAVVKGQYYQSEYRGAQSTRGEFESEALGASLELGKRLEPFGPAWFLELGGRLDYTHLFANSYDLEHNQDATRVKNSDADIFRFAQTAKLGRVFDLGEGRFIEPAVHVGIEEQTSAGGRVKIKEENFRPNTDGVRGLVGFGVVYQFTPSQQVHFDYETAFGDKYDRPWAVNAGYRVRF